MAITVVAYVIYFRRYYRRDLLLAYFSLNVGVFAVTALLAESTAGVGLGLGLFGILSIIRLRSSSITQEEIAYYFVALALGLIAGLAASPVARPGASAVLVAVTFVVDHPALTARSQRQNVTLDRAYPDRAQLAAALERLLGAEVRHLVVLQLDLVLTRPRSTCATRSRARPAPSSRRSCPQFGTRRLRERRAHDQSCA